MSRKDYKAKSLDMSRDRAPQSVLTNLVEKSELDEVVYYDPLGFKGEPVDARGKMHDDVQDIAEEVAERLKTGMSGYRAAEKAMETGRIAVPLFTFPEFRISDGAAKPLAETLPRAAVNEKDLEYDEVIDVKTAERTNEGGSIADNDNTIVTHRYEIDIYGVKDQTTDLVQLAASEKSPRQLQEETAREAIRRYEDLQGLRGTNNDPSGFEGLEDFAANHGSQLTNTGVNVGSVRDVITELRKLNTNYGDMLIIVGHEDFASLKSSLDDVQRFESPDEEIDFGVQALKVDGVPVVESNAAPSGYIYGADVSMHNWAMLEDITQKPLAPGDTVENFLHYAHGVLVSEAQQRVVVSSP